jgi:hypothetical protein
MIEQLSKYKNNPILFILLYIAYTLIMGFLTGCLYYALIYIIMGWLVDIKLLWALGCLSVVLFN